MKFFIFLIALFFSIQSYAIGCLQERDLIEKDWGIEKTEYLASQGNAYAQYNYAQGLRFKQENSGKAEEPAARWYRESFSNFIDLAKNGDGAAYWHIGFMLNNGYGMPQDSEQALMYYIESGKAGCGSGYVSAATMTNNEKEKVKYYIRCIEETSEGQCRRNLGNRYLTGSGVKADWKLALKWYREGCLLESKIACTNLGNIYFDVDRANYWEFNKIPENSLKNLRKLKSYEKALYWFYEAQNFHRKFTGNDTYAFVSDEIQSIEAKFASKERKRIERESNRKSGVYHLGESARDVKNFFQDLYNSEPITNLKDMLDKFKKDFSEGYSD